MRCSIGSEIEVSLSPASNFQCCCAYVTDEARCNGASWSEVAMLDAVMKDVRYAGRALRRSPGFFAVAVLSLGLGAGGVLQGMKLANADVPFMNVVRGTVPFVGLSTMGVLLLLIGQLVFLTNYFKLLCAFTAPMVRTVCAVCCGCGSTAKSGVRS